MNVKFISITTLSLLTLYGCNSNQVGNTPANPSTNSLVNNQTSYTSPIATSPRIAINENKFLEMGGYDYFKKQSEQTEFLSVGKLTITNSTSRSICTGTIIGQSESIVNILTATHCVSNRNNTIMVKPNVIFIFITFFS